MLRFTDVDHQPTRFPPIYGYHNHPLLPLRQALEPILSQIDELDHYIKIAKRECNYPSEHDLTRDESASIYLYTMEWGEQSLYRALNNALRIEDRSKLVPWHGYLKLFDTALGKLPSLSANLWRGINKNISENYKEGTKVTWWHINSCSTAIKVVQDFLGPVSTLFMIEAKNGKNISAYSNFPNEKEVILGLGTRLCVKCDPLDHSNMNVVHMIELSDEDDEESSLSNTISMNNTWPLKKTTSTSKTLKNQEYPSFKVVSYADGGRYEGESRNEEKHGKGIYYYANGNKYIGDWIEDQKDGEGILTWSNGDRYEGQFKKGNFNGKGTKYFATGAKYVGDWIDDKMTGDGVYTWANGSRYEGQFIDGNFNGKGTRYFPSGNKYTGDWINDKMSGQGVFTWPNGDRFEGQFRDGKMHGQGKLYSNNRLVQQGTWVNDNFND